MNNLSLDALIQGVSKSVTDVHERMEAHDIDMFQTYMDIEKDEAGEIKKLKPKTVAIALPTKTGEYKEREIPIVSLVNISSLELENIKVKIAFNAGWNSEDNKMDVNVGSTKKKEGKNEKGMTHEIELNFVREDTPEGLSRIANKFIETI